MKDKFLKLLSTIKYIVLWPMSPTPEADSFVIGFNVACTILGLCLGIVWQSFLLLFLAVLNVCAAVRMVKLMQRRIARQKLRDELVQKILSNGPLSTISTNEHN